MRAGRGSVQLLQVVWGCRPAVDGRRRGDGHGRQGMHVGGQPRHAAGDAGCDCQGGGLCGTPARRILQRRRIMDRGLARVGRRHKSPRRGAAVVVVVDSSSAVSGRCTYAKAIPLVLRSPAAAVDPRCRIPVSCEYRQRREPRLR